MSQKIFIFGENHIQLNEIQSYYNQIRKLHKEFKGNIILLHELLFQDFIPNKEVALKRLKDSGENKLADPRVNIDIYQLLIELNIKGYGIEYDYLKDYNQFEWNKLSLKERFKLRENHMLKMIQLYCKTNDDKQIVIVLGDTHLRTIKTKDLGDISPIYKYFKDNPSVIITRSKFGEIK